MAQGKRGDAARHVQTLFQVSAIGGLTDGQLLEWFTTRKDEAAEHAFAALIERHGAMVFRVCRAIPRHSHDAEDTFQATFLVLVRRARSLRVRNSLGPWLHQVAYRTASSARSAADRRRHHEGRAAPLAAAQDDSRADWHDVGPVLHEELARLPERYLAVVVLCLLEGLTHEQAVQTLRCPLGTIQSRLARLAGPSCGLG